METKKAKLQLRHEHPGAARCAWGDSEDGKRTPPRMSRGRRGGGLQVGERQGQ